MLFELFFSVIAIAFILQFLDSSVGMGYGTITPILLLLGFPPLEAISAVLLSSAFLSLFAGFLHHGAHNVDLKTKMNLKILSVLLSFGVVAIILAAFLANSIPEMYLKIYIGALIILVGLLIFINNRKNHFSFKKLIFFGSLASFNQGLSGGGYGPVLASGQIASGVESKNAVAITALSEGFVSIIGFLTYLLIEGPAHMNWGLIISLIVGGAVSTPLAVLAIKNLKAEKLKYFIASASIIFGILILIQVFV